MDTIIVNLFGAPGAGKSTTRAGVFHKLKLAGCSVEEVVEFAKDLVWEERHMALACQPYIFAKQLKNLERIMGKVSVIVTDSPLLLSSFYIQRHAPKRYPESFCRYVEDQFNSMNAINFLLRRVKPYNPVGRLQDESDSNQIAVELLDFLDVRNIPFNVVDGDEEAANEIVEWLTCK